MNEFVMPSLGADMESGTLLEWMIKPGDTVDRGQVVAVVGTEKGEIEVEIWEEGLVDQLLVKEGVEVPVGAPLARIRGEGEEAAPAAAPAEEAEKVAVPEAAAEAGAAGTKAPPVKAAAPPTNGHRMRVSPLARRVADELDVDLTHVTGTGPGGSITRSDVEAAAKAAEEKAKAAATKAQAPPPPKEKPAAEVEAPQAAAAKPAAKSAPAKAGESFQTGMRRAIALAMARANREIPHYYLERRIDMTAAQAWLEEENRKRSIKERVLPVVLLIKAVAKALTKVPELNGFWLDDQLQPQEAIHIGFAIALRQGGLITPAIHHADLKDMDEMMEAIRDLIMRTRAGRLRSSEMTDSTITLTSLGDMGVEKVYGVIYPPQVALVGFGKVMDEVWVENGMLGVRPVVHATLAGDHRASDGRTGALFLEELNKLLQDPAKLWE